MSKASQVVRRFVSTQLIERFKANPWSANKDDIDAICDEASRAGEYRRALEVARGFIRSLNYLPSSEVIKDIDAALGRNYGEPTP